MVTERSFVHSIEHLSETLGEAAKMRYLHNVRSLATLHWIEGIISELAIELYGLNDLDREAIISVEGLPAYWQPLLGDRKAVSGIDPELLLAVGNRSIKWGIKVVSGAEVAVLKGRLRRSLSDEAGIDQTPLDNSVLDLADEDRHELPPSDATESAARSSGHFVAETELEKLSRDLSIHPTSTYHLIEELAAKEWSAFQTRLKPYLEDYASVAVLWLLGYRWPEQDAYEQEHGPILPAGLVDDDGIIPLVPCGEHLTAERLLERRLEVEFGEPGAAQSESEFRQWVGRDLGDWLRREFFKRHVQQFKQRPIAWHLVSPERTFEAVVLYHKLSRATLERLRTDYAGVLIGTLRADLERARERKAMAEVSRLQAQIEDVEEFRERLQKIERGDELKYRIRCRWKGEEEGGRPGPYNPDIDDGVKVNIRPFQEAGLLGVREVIKKW